MNLSRFQVDLGGLIDLLSSNLYSGPHVFLRELIQNAVDAVSARRSTDPDAPDLIKLWCDDVLDEHSGNSRRCLFIQDNGIGLTAREAQELLATIGSSSKRTIAADFIGQFGVGMLAAFMVADHIDVSSKSATANAQPIRWVGHSNGEFELSEHSGDHPIGTTLRIVAKQESEHWFNEETIATLASDFAHYIPMDIRVAKGTNPRRWHRITSTPPWQDTYATAGARNKALRSYCERTFGFTPLTHIDLNIDVAGVSGVAFVLPSAVAPGTGQHRVYVKHMLLSPRTDDLLPPWAFFTRAVVMADTLTPAASREQLRMDDTLLAVRDELGKQLKTWAKSSLRERSQRAYDFISIHHLALRSLALSDDEMLDLVADVLPYQTTDGLLTLSEAAQRGDIIYTRTTEAYRRIEAVARAQGMTIVNAGYVYDSDILTRLNERGRALTRELRSQDLAQALSLPSLERDFLFDPVLRRARTILDEDDVDVILRRFEPTDVTALLLRDPEGEYQKSLNEEQQQSKDRWSGLLDSLGTSLKRHARTLVLNDASPNLNGLLTACDKPIFDDALRSLYLSAVLLTGEGLNRTQTNALNDSLASLLSAALDSRQTRGTDE